MYKPLLLALVLLPLAGCSNIFKGGEPEETDDDGDGYSEVEGDCDDSDANINPGESEAPGDGVDNDCDEATTDDDVDGDGYSEAEGDCDDNAAAIHPGAAEVPYNGKDDDCKPTTRDDDLDADGYDYDSDCNDRDASIHPGAAEIPYNGDDDDCSTATRDDDLDRDGYLHATDCDDDDNTSHPGAIEVLNDTADNDCDGLVDERFDLEVIDETGDRGLSNAIAVDSSGAVFVAYYDYEDGDLYYAKRTTTWAAPAPAVATAGFDTGDWLDLVIDAADNLMIGYTSYNTQAGAMELDFIQRTASGTWSEEYVIDAGTYDLYSYLGMVNSDNVGSFVSMALDSDQLPSFAYLDWTNGAPILADMTSLGVVAYAPVDMPSRLLDADVASGWFASLAVDSTGYDHVVYYDAEDLSLAGYGYPDEVQYTMLDYNYDSLVLSESVSAGRAGYYTSTAMLGDQPCAAWMDADTADLKYACRLGKDNWAVETVDSSGRVGAHAQLAFNSKGTPYIAYFDQGTNKVKVAVKEGQHWVKVTVGDASTVDDSDYRWMQKALDIAIDGEDGVHVSYYDATTRTLRYARGH